MKDFMSDVVVEAHSTGFGNYLEPGRPLADVPGFQYVTLRVPEYERNGLGRMVADTIRYRFRDLGSFGCEARSIGAETTRGHMIYEDMEPNVVGGFANVMDLATSVGEWLMGMHYSTDMVVVGVLKAKEMGLRAIDTAEDQSRLRDALAKYHRRASWMEAHALQVRMANLEAQAGQPAPFDWARIFPDVETGEV